MEKKETLLEWIPQQGILPLYFYKDTAVSMGVLRALYAAGIRAVEYTNRGEAALKNFKEMRKVCDIELKDMYLGVGTIKNGDMAQTFIDVGTDFIVCPGLVGSVAEVSDKNKLLWIPGCMTPSEIIQAEALGAKMIKLFPGNILSPGFVSAIKEIFPGLLFMPTGGVELNKENISAWFKAGVCAVGMGSKLITKELLESKDYQQITAATLEVLAIISSHQTPVMMVEKMSKYRWAICSLIFFATTINYIDRSVISFLKSTFTEHLHWTDADYTDVETTFKVFYAIGLLGAGRLIDKLGTKKGYGLFAFLWSIAGIATALVNTVVGFQVIRGALGLSEAGNFPAAIKSVAEWFPKKERALATGIFNSGANIGAIITPLTVPFILIHWGWQWAFIITGILGLIWVVFWFALYEVPHQNKHVSAAELNFIESDRDEAINDAQPKLTWLELLKLRQTWAFAIGKLLTDPIWWFYLFWLPDFFESIYHIKITGASWPVAVVYIVSTFGSVGGGWLPLYLIENRGWTVRRARKIAMLIYALCVLPIVFALVLSAVNIWLAVGVIGLAAAAHQAWSANILTTVSDMFPKRSTASVAGIGGMFGAIGGILLSQFVQKDLFMHYRASGHIETAYYIMFIVCALAYLAAWLIMQLLTGKISTVTE